ncbi:MAG TPA: BAX inhibitor (BI)-1/YccA family protein, partial [Alphaproteobacteria bacterium]|nr:BAX inhibitor (BI)-1/YccA family protein [Alphaproteobacteria bacterium]
MAQQRFDASTRGRATSAVEIDEGLRAFMLKVYNYMGLGLALTGAVAFFTASSPAMMQAIHGTAL